MIPFASAEKPVGDAELRTAYGLILRSDLLLPELRPAETSIGPVDVTVRICEKLDDGLHEGCRVGPLLWAAPDALRLHIPGVAQYLIRGGTDIQVAPERGVEEDVLRLFLLGSAFGALLMQRGLLVLHGSAVVRDGVAIVALGHSGAGKSTLAEALRRKGCAVLADDVVAVDGTGQALAGIPRIKLWRDATEHWGIDRSSLRPVRSNLEKYHVNTGGDPQKASMPVRHIYALGAGHGSVVKIEPLGGFDAFNLLLQQVYRPRFLDAMSLRARNLPLMTELAGRARLARATRPHAGFSADALAEAIMDDIRDR